MHIIFAACAVLAMSTTPKTDLLAEGQPSIRTLPVSRTPESNTVAVKIAFPTKGKIYQNPVWVQFKVDGYSLGSASQFERASEIKVSNMGQTVHVIVDNDPYFAINQPAIDPFDESNFYYDTKYKFEMPYRLSDGMHTIRMFPARSFGESLKGGQTFAATYFYVGDQTDNADMNLNMPYLTFNEPNDHMSFEEGTPILLDFLISNAELSSNGYKVRLTIDDKVTQIITSWQPFYIYGLMQGKHTISLELIGSTDKVVPGFFNSVTRTIMIRPFV